MSQEKNPSPSPKKQTSAAASKTPAEPVIVPPLFRRIDWWTFGLTTLLIFIGYMWTLSPDVTLEDSGELAVASDYAGVPHPPGYPVWTLYTWFFTVILPFSNIAWRVAVSSAVAGALACGLIGLIVSRGSSMILESITALKNIDRKVENSICISAGFVAALLMGFNGYMWSQAVIVEVYTLSVLSLMGVLCMMLRWMYAPHQRRYLRWALFFFGLCLTNHMSLLVAAIGIEIGILVASRNLGRDLFLGNFIIYVVVLILKGKGMVSPLENNPPLFAFFNVIGVGSLAVFAWAWISTEKFLTEWKEAFILGGMWLLGAAFYLYMPLASMSNPPMNWGYARTAEGFMHALKRGQYESVRPATSLPTFIQQTFMYGQGAAEEFTVVYLLIALVPIWFLVRMQQREKAWLIGLLGIGFCLSMILLFLLNPALDRQSKELHRVFFTASHVVVAIFIGYGLTLTAGYIVTQYKTSRLVLLAGGGIAVLASLYNLAKVTTTFFAESGHGGVSLLFHGIGRALTTGQNILPVGGALILLGCALVFLVVIALSKTQVKLPIILAAFVLMPIPSIFSHWADNEQRGHMYGYWFGHDMFTPPFGIYPEMTRDAVLFGGTDPGRFNPTYMIFSESFTPAEKKHDEKFDRRDVYLITQNALADQTYLNYIRAHYNRSAQIDPPFFVDFFKTKALKSLDTLFLGIGDKIEKKRRTFTSWFEEDHFTDLNSLAAKLKAKGDPLSAYIVENLAADTQELLGSPDDKLRSRLARDLNKLIDREKLYDTNRFAKVELSARTQHFVRENPQSHTRVRLNRILLEEAYPKEIAKSLGGVYPDFEILTPTPDDSQKAFNDYLLDADRRQKLGQLKPGEDFRNEGGRVQVSGQVAVMNINALLTKVIFDKNPTHEFFIEESFPLEWMYPYLSPYGIIMKINRQPLAEMTQEMVDKDHKFWSQFSERLIGNWITYDTPVSNICAWAEKTYLRRDFEGFTGDRKFIRDDNAQKAFSKLRSSIGGVYSWRTDSRNVRNPVENQRMMKEADFTFKQAFAYCPYSPEAVYRYVNLLLAMNRLEDAVLIVNTCKKFDPYNPQIDALLKDLERMRGMSRSGLDLNQVMAQVAQLMQSQQTGAAFQLLDQAALSAQNDPNALMNLAQLYLQYGNPQKSEAVIQRMVTVMPTSGEGWYNLAGLQAIQGKVAPAAQSLKRAIQLSRERRLKDPNAIDLAKHAQTDPNFNNIRNTPQFQEAIK